VAATWEDIVGEDGFDIVDGALVPATPHDITGGGMVDFDVVGIPLIVEPVETAK